MNLVTESFKSIPFKPRELKASPEVLEKIYNAAKLGLKGDALAFAAGLLPVEYRRLCQLDNAAAVAEGKGRADSEVEAAAQLRSAALEGDSKAALALLTHLHGWVAKQQVQVDIKSQISIVAALQEAESRVLAGRVYDATPDQLAHEQSAATRAYASMGNRRIAHRGAWYRFALGNAWFSAAGRRPERIRPRHRGCAEHSARCQGAAGV